MEIFGMMAAMLVGVGIAALLVFLPLKIVRRAWPDSKLAHFPRDVTPVVVCVLGTLLGLPVAMCYATYFSEDKAFGSIVVMDRIESEFGIQAFGLSATDEASVRALLKLAPKREKECESSRRLISALPRDIPLDQFLDIQASPFARLYELRCKNAFRMNDSREIQGRIKAKLVVPNWIARVTYNTLMPDASVSEESVRKMIQEKELL